MNVLKLLGKFFIAFCVSIFLVVLLSIFDIIPANSNAIYSTLFIVITLMLIAYCIKRVSVMPTFEKKMYEVFKILLVIVATYVLINIASIYFVIDKLNI